jgi:hypothetical protein
MKTIQELTNIANARITAMAVPCLTPESDQEDKNAYIQKVINEYYRQYLASTDWYVLRFSETGVSIPSEITSARAEARTKVI